MKLLPTICLPVIAVTLLAATFFLYRISDKLDSIPTLSTTRSNSSHLDTKLKNMPVIYIQGGSVDADVGAPLEVEVSNITPIEVEIEQSSLDELKVEVTNSSLDVNVTNYPLEVRPVR